MKRTVIGFLAGVLSLALVSTAYGQDNIYFGNLHSHTSYSDGSSTPDKAYKHAKDAGLDFLAITEHNHSQAGQIATNHSLYSGTASTSLISRAKQFNGSSAEFVGENGRDGERDHI